MVLFSPPFRGDFHVHPPRRPLERGRCGGRRRFLYVWTGPPAWTPPPSWTPVSDAAWLVRETARWLDRHLPEASRPWRTSLPRGWPGAGPVERSQARPPLGGVAIFRRQGRRGGVLWPGDCAASLQLTDGTFRTWEGDRPLRPGRPSPGGGLCPGPKPGGCSLRLPGIRPPSAATGPCGTPRGLLDPGPHRGGDLPRPPGDGPPEPVPALFLCTDGLAQCGASAWRRTWPTSIAGRQRGDGPLADRLWACQAADPDLEALPRFKRRDDATGALCQVG